MITESKTYYQSEIGLLEIVGTVESIKSVVFMDLEAKDRAGDLPAAVAECLTQLDEYFRGERQSFLLKLEPAGTAFQQAVWRELLTIPYGQTVSYLDIAHRLGDEQAVRAVGTANAQNKIAIIIPCHRVVGSDGKLVGYGGGLWRKAWLLNHEKKRSSGQLALF